MSDNPKKTAPPWLAESSTDRRTETVNKFNSAIATIELEILQNDNIYPYNGGTINQAEVCRRANVKKAILQAETHKTTTKKIVDTWIEEANKKLITGKRNIRKAVTERVDNWKDEHEKLRDAYLIDMLKLEVAEARINKLEQENAALREAFGNKGSNVSAFPGTPKKG